MVLPSLPSALLRIACACACACSSLAHAAPGERVVLADPDPELLRAVTSTLAPWRLEVIVDPDPPANTGDAQHRADARSARFVVWRRDGDLVVFDRERGAAEHREGRTGTLDPIEAASAALTVKTLMRLPPPEAAGARPRDAGPSLRVAAGLASRFSSPGIDARFSGGLTLEPWSTRGWGFGVAGDFGTAIDLQEAGFRGSWSDWAILAVASYRYEPAPWRVEPFIALGFTRSTLDGTAMMDPVIQHDLLGAVRGGVLGAWTRGRWSAGLALAVEGVTSTPTYTKAGASATIFEVPGIRLVAGAFIAADLGL